MEASSDFTGRIDVQRGTSRKSSAVLIGTVLLAGTSVLAQAAEETTDYKVVCEVDASSGANVCKVDKKTYIGWRTFSSSCLRCHGQDAVGSTFAPSLLDTLKRIDKERFMNSVTNGYTGDVGVMPPWKDDPNVNKRFEELYAYLKARSDGVLPPGRPPRLD